MTLDTSEKLWQSLLKQQKFLDRDFIAGQVNISRIGRGVKWTEKKNNTEIMVYVNILIGLQNKLCIKDCPKF